MKAEAYLNQMHLINEHIDSLTRELRELESRADSLGSPSFEPRIQTSGNANAPFVNACIKIADMQMEINNEINRLDDIRRDVKTTIEAVPSETQKALLRYKFVNGLQWEEVADSLNYSVRRVFQIYADALDSVDRILSTK